LKKQSQTTNRKWFSSLGVRLGTNTSITRKKDVIMCDLKENGQTDVDWTPLALGRGQWWGFVNMIMNLQD
jgi:hypothetical protein